jgi:hypothetical protein
MNRPNPAGDYVEHFDPELPHNRAWLLAVLEQLVAHEPQALAEFGVSARLVQSADFQLIEQQIARGIPVPCGYIHRGPVPRPTGSGHWLIVYGHTPTQVVVNDPWGEPDLIHGTTLHGSGLGAAGHSGGLRGGARCASGVPPRGRAVRGVPLCVQAERGFLIAHGARAAAAAAHCS